jgi:hypothetical protein
MTEIVKNVAHTIETLLDETNDNWGGELGTGFPRELARIIVDDYHVIPKKPIAEDDYDKVVRYLAIAHKMGASELGRETNQSLAVKVIEDQKTRLEAQSLQLDKIRELCADALPYDFPMGKLNIILGLESE